MNPADTALRALLAELEAALRAGSRWESAPPDPAALESVEPFCVDTLDFTQWLQWVFIPRMQALLDARHPLPARCGIAAMGEVVLVGNGKSTERILAALLAIDRLVGGERTDSLQ